MFSLLIVDDEPLIRRGIQKLLDLKNLNIDEVFEATNGEEALKIFEQHRIDIVLLDINMPKIDGLTVAKKMKLLSPEVKIAVITGYSYFDYAQTAIKIGIDDYILKPVSKKDISGIIFKLVHSLNKTNKEKELVKVLEKDSMLFETNKEDFSIKNDYREIILELMEQYYTDKQFNLSFLATKIDLSSGYVSSIFKKIFGLSFQDYLLEKRMKMAKILLLTTELKNYEIADKIGFEDVNYFSLKFKKFYNISPKQYKEQVLSNENK